ncbi:hypothetical protein [Sulfitobacter sp. S190]|nr:hypothetical protein [Sulfitobacter sp. S190]UWR22858.1 hypothetical protein K3756_02335 [Sulfitobacter sp. S190]
MFRLLKFLTVLMLGAVLGFHLNGLLMRSECAAGEGQWTGTICVDSELLQ